MVSTAYIQFEREHYSKGREKIDGYSLNNVSLLRGDEREKAIELLSNEAEHFGGAIDALVHIDEHIAKDVVNDILSRRHQLTSSESVFWYWSWKFNPSEEKADKIIRCLVESNDVNVTRILGYVKCLPNYSFVVEALEWLVLNSKDKVNVSLSASQLLNRTGCNFEDENNISIRQQIKGKLKNGSFEEKKEALNEIRADIQIIT